MQTGVPRLGLFDLSVTNIVHVLPVAAVVALVVLTQSAATTRAFADLGRYNVDVGRDFIGVGAGSILAGLCGSFPVNASPPRTAAVEGAGGRTQAAGLFAAAALTALIPLAGLLADVPLATLGAVLVFIATRIFHGRELRDIFVFDKIEFALALITLLVVALVGVEEGIGVAVGLALLDRTRLSATPQLHVLGRVYDTTSWAPLSVNRGASQVPGVLAVMFATPLWYANAVNFHTQVQTAMTRVEGAPQLMVLDALGMSDLDYTGARTLRVILDELDAEGVAFALARAGARVQESLRDSGLLERIGESNLYHSVDEAVLSLATPPGLLGARYNPRFRTGLVGDREAGDA